MVIDSFYSHLYLYKISMVIIQSAVCYFSTKRDKEISEMVLAQSYYNTSVIQYNITVCIGKGMLCSRAINLVVRMTEGRSLGICSICCMLYGILNKASYCFSWRCTSDPDEVCWEVYSVTANSLHMLRTHWSDKLGVWDSVWTRLKNDPSWH